MCLCVCVQYNILFYSVYNKWLSIIMQYEYCPDDHYSILLLLLIPLIYWYSDDAIHCCDMIQIVYSMIFIAVLLLFLIQLLINDILLYYSTVLISEKAKPAMTSKYTIQLMQ